MYWKKFIYYVLPVSLTVLIHSCSSEKFQLELVSSTLLPHFPSASAIEYDQGHLFVFGDDASTVLILDTGFHQLDTVRFLPDTNYRSSKDTKADIESAAIIRTKTGEKKLVAMSSFSTALRNSVFVFPIADIHDPVQFHPERFFRNLKEIKELNIEGLAITGDRFVLSNRANTTNKNNQLVICDNFLDKTKNTFDYKVIEIVLDLPSVAGISGLFYLEENDILFFTASEEDTPNAMQDGVIKDSYLGWFRNFSEKKEKSSLQPDVLVSLSSVDTIFHKQKIESVCMEQIKNNQIILYLAADNDNGQSRLFKMKLIL